MKRGAWLVLFLVINFGSLALGSYLMNDGPRTNWYINLNKAPWTPPGWVFGVAWTSIMICFSIYLSYLFSQQKTKQAIFLFITQVILNISWNYVFFNQHQTILGLVSIALLTMVMFVFYFSFTITKSKYIKHLLLPYIVWLCIATSLNAYIVLNN